MSASRSAGGCCEAIEPTIAVAMKRRVQPMRIARREIRRRYQEALHSFRRSPPPGHATLSGRISECVQTRRIQDHGQVFERSHRCPRFIVERFIGHMLGLMCRRGSRMERRVAQPLEEVPLDVIGRCGYQLQDWSEGFITQATRESYAPFIAAAVQDSIGLTLDDRP